ncbi:MAG: hydrolase 1, exosortase A system-associated [Sphingomonas sp.]
MDRIVRRLTTFPCDGETLAASIDAAAGGTGLLIVTGGAQTRIGAHRGLARLAMTVAAAGFPVFRFERRGVGDSSGDDPGFAGSGPDIAAAAAAFRETCPHVRRILGFGLCDGATALALHHAAAGIDGLILANPWLIEPVADLPPPAAIRRRYLDRLTSLSGWRRALTGGFEDRMALRGLAAIGRPAGSAPLAEVVARALAAGGGRIEILLARGDATAIAFADAWGGARFAALRRGGRATLAGIDSRSHSFASGGDPAWLAAACLSALRSATPAA